MQHPMLVPRVYSIVSVHGRGGGVQHLWRLHRCITTELGRWQRRYDRLSQLQQRIRFPPVDTIAFGSEACQLPLRSIDPERAPSTEELEYLVGFFDGDGCVTMERTGQVKLAVSQNVDSADVLLRFRSLLGGGVGLLASATGTSKATLKWHVTGYKMTAAADVLSTVPSMKQAQLLIAAKGRVAAPDIPLVHKELKLLKQKEHVPHHPHECSWSYFAGFFDAEGCISVRPLNVGLQLRMDQVNPCVPVHLLGFLHERQLRTWSLYHRATCSSLVCSNLQDCRKTLELLLEYGLLVKRQQAELALSLAAENHLQIRDTISSLNGLQSRYKRLDTHGIARAREIQRLQRRLRYSSGQEHANMLSRVEELRVEHHLKTLISQCHLLGRDLRLSLREGGEVISDTTRSS